MHFTALTTPLGMMIAGAVPAGICMLDFAANADDSSEHESVSDASIHPDTRFHLELLTDELVRYFARDLREFTVPLVYAGTPFQQKVWDALRTIPYGETRSYQQIAAAIGQPKAVRTVGRANGQNRIAIIIPCHRVVRKGGQLGGYGGGLDRKQYLLALEAGGPPTRQPQTRRRHQAQTQPKTLPRVGAQAGAQAQSQPQPQAQSQPRTTGA